MRDEIRRAGYSTTDPLTVIEFVESLLTSSNDLWDELKNPFRTPHITPDLFTNVDSLVSSGFNENTGKKMKANPSHSAGGGDGGDDNGGGGGDDDDDEWDVEGKRMTPQLKVMWQMVQIWTGWRLYTKQFSVKNKPTSK